MGIADKVAGTLAETTVMKKAIDSALTNAKVDDKNEYTSLNFVRASTITDISETKAIYQHIFELEEVDVDINALNSAGWLNNDLIHFHNKYLPTSTLETILENRSNKIIQDTALLNGEDVNIDTFKEIQKQIDVYGRCLIVLDEYIPTSFNDSTFYIVEPYRYLKTDTGYVVITYTGDNEHGHITYSVTKYEDNLVEVTKKEINKKGKLITLGQETTSVEVMFAYEINTHKKATLDTIKTTLALLSLTETVLAVETKNSSFSIHADANYFQSGRVIQSDFYRIYNSSTTLDGTPPLYEAFQPLLRQADYNELKNSYKEEVASALAMSTRALGIANTTDITATGELLFEESTIQTINASKTRLKAMLNPFLQLYFKSELEIPVYISDSLILRAKSVENVKDVSSIETIVGILHPEYDDDKKKREIILVKLEKDILLTTEEEAAAREMNLIPGDTFSTENNFGS